MSSTVLENQENSGVSRLQEKISKWSSSVICIKNLCESFLKGKMRGVHQDLRRSAVYTERNSNSSVWRTNSRVFSVLIHRNTSITHSDPSMKFSSYKVREILANFMLCLKSCLSVDLIDQSWLCLVSWTPLSIKFHRFGELITTGTICSHRPSWYWLTFLL